MLATAHVAVGALVGRAMRSGSLLALAGTALGSHFVLDALPHWGLADRRADSASERLFMRVATIDGLTALTASALLIRRSACRSATLCGIAFSVAPDLNKPAEVLGLETLYPRRLARWHSGIQRLERPSRWPIDVAVAATAFALSERPAGSVGLLIHVPGGGAQCA